MNSDITPSEPARLVPSKDGRWISFIAPIAGSEELWRIAVRGGELERTTEDRHFISSFDEVTRPGGRLRAAFIRSSPTEMPDLWVRDGVAGKPRRVTSFNADALADVELAEPSERHVTVEGRDIQGWYLPPLATADTARRGRRGASSAPPLVTQIHGGPHTHYGWAPVLEFQILAAEGMGVFYSNPRGSDGYGREFNEANLRDWGPGPARDVLAGIDAARDSGFESIKLNTVVIRGYNDDELIPILDFARGRGVEVRFIEYMDVGGATGWHMGLVVSRAEMLEAIGRERGPVTPLAEPGSRAPAERFALGDGTTFGIIASTTAPFCRSCDRSRVTADGTWFLCLYGEDGVDLRTPLRAGASDPELAAIVRDAWTARADRGAELRAALPERGALHAIEGLRADPRREMHTRGG